MASDKVVGRRRYSEELKAEVMTECDAPGASGVKAVMARGINANVVHRWRQLAREGGQATAAKPQESAAVAIAPQLTVWGLTFELTGPGGPPLVLRLSEGLGRSWYGLSPWCITY